MSWLETVRNRLPGLRFGDSWWVGGNILIDDIGLNKLGLEDDIPATDTPVYILAPQFLNSLLFEVFNPKDYEVIVWPREGARTVKKSLGLDKGIEVVAKRYDYKNPKATVKRFSVKPGKTVAVIDDIICSGVTALEVFKKGGLKENRAFLAAWIIQTPEDRRLRCYEKILSGLLVRGPRGKVPINSLSAFIERAEVLRDYAARYAQDEDEFVWFFNWLREEGVSRDV